MNPSSPTDKQSAESKPKTRAGCPLSEKVPMTIGFSEKMEFTGRTVDPEGRPAARADFYGIVTAQMEDALLHCTEKMIAFTDQEVPLAQLGQDVSESRSQDASRSDERPLARTARPNRRPSSRCIYCYRNAIAISRKVDPDAPILIQKQRIEADDILAYDRRTGDFYVPGKGKVYLYDRSDNSSQPRARAWTATADSQDNGNPGLTATQRTVTTTSGRAPQRTRRTAAPGDPVRTRQRTTGETRPRNRRPADDLPADSDSDPFQQGNEGPVRKRQGERQRSRPAGPNSSATSSLPAPRYRCDKTSLDPDELPSDGLFLTGQTLRVISEPPPVGSPKSAPAR